ncbi:uncharacterized protein LOC106056421 isoform X2 [Biomphalaria glabrata]|uniref:Uncharacterized protein LOC106056421 isoform X2 n=1 Tax=Biomphalaria glabrata TaxID=6526 RepID=A0A9W3APQ1_BIOGL|nr:uncharacterized protein LOC106056421 isoform X2 [Biomphalaria glabrata]
MQYFCGCAAPTVTYIFCHTQTQGKHNHCPQVDTEMSKSDSEHNSVRSTSNQELKNEIKIILEEFLLKDLEVRQKKPGTTPRRNKSDPFTERIRLPPNSVKNGVPKSKSMSPQILGSSLKSRKELEKVHSDTIDSSHKENGFLSSAESDGDQHVSSLTKKKKKSRFKRASVIINHFLNRKEKKTKETDSSSTLSAGNQTRKTSETLSTSSAYRVSDLDTPGYNASPKTKKPSIFMSFRKNKKSTKKDDENTPALKLPPAQPINITDNKADRANETSGSLLFINAEPPPPPPSHSSRSNSSSPPASNLASSSSTNYPASDVTLNTIGSSAHSNALDDPGEDIDYMDIEPYELTSPVSDVRNNFGLVPRKMSASKFLDSGGIKHLQLLAQAHQESRSKLDRISGSKMNADAVDGANKEHDNKQEAPQRQKSKEELYGKIAKKLAEMADQYSSESAEANGAAASAPLSDLEREIISCLRSEGDRNSAIIEEKFEAMAAQTADEAYQRFKSTIKSSVNNELSWDHLAFVFYTTKAVISAVGKGTKAASKAKEYSLEYISDTFATWIMDQGGFDTIMSSSDSDFDVD